MRVARLNGAKSFAICDEPVPEPAPHEALVRVGSVGVCGSDVHIYRDGRSNGNELEKPLVLGHEAVGVVEKLGADVTSLSVGQRVFVEPQNSCLRCEDCLRGNSNLCPNVLFLGMPPQDGAYREYMCYPEHLLFALPDEVGDDEGVLIEPLSISLSAYYLARCKMPASFAILGCGTMGLTVLMILKYSGAQTVFATDLLDYRLELARELGADYTFNPSKVSTVDEVMKLTGGRGVDYVFEAAGADETPGEGVKMLRAGGKIVVIGANQNDMVLFPSTSGRRKGITLFMARRARNTIAQTIDLVASKTIDPKKLITHTFDLEGIGEAFDIVSNYSDNVLKAVIRPGEGESIKN